MRASHLAVGRDGEVVVLTILPSTCNLRPHTRWQALAVAADLLHGGETVHLVTVCRNIDPFLHGDALATVRRVGFGGCVGVGA